MKVILMEATRLPACRVEHSDMVRTASPYCQQDGMPRGFWKAAKSPSRMALASECRT